MNQYEIESMNALSPIHVRALDKGKDVNLVDIIAANRGWHPPVVGEKMTIHFNGREYEIVRNK